jgi:hypothetical protein
MKVNKNERSLLLQDINDAISHSAAEGLPLESIELDHAEWKLLRLDQYSNATDIMHRGVKIFRGAE